MNKELNNFNRNLNDTITVEEAMLDFLDCISPYFKNVMMLKGCMALKINVKFNDDLRGTRDLDMNFATPDYWELFCSNSCRIATTKTKLGVIYRPIKRRGFEKNPNGDSLTINYQLPNGSTDVFKVDMNFGNLTDYFETNDFTEESIKVYNVYGILSDKLKVLSIQKIRRRIKDLLDVYYIANSTEIDLNELITTINRKYPEIKESLMSETCFTLNPHNLGSIKQAYSKFEARGVESIDFDEVYDLVFKFSSVIYSEVLGASNKYSRWNPINRLWER